MKTFALKFAALSCLSFFLTAETFSQGLLGRSAADLNSDPIMEPGDVALLDARARVLRIPNLSNPACSLEIGKSLNSDTKSQGIQVITRFKLNTEIVAVVAQVGKDLTEKIDSKTKKVTSLFENKKYVYIVHFMIDDMKNTSLDQYQYQPFDSNFGNVPGLAIRLRDRKFILATQSSDLDRAAVKFSPHVKVEKYSFESYKNVLYPRFRKIELAAFEARDLPAIEEGVRELEKKDKEFRELFKEKIRTFKLEQQACESRVGSQR